MRILSRKVKVELKMSMKTRFKSKMKKWGRKVASILAGVAILALYLESSSAFAANKTHITFWYSLTGKNGDFVANLSQKFNASQNEIEVKAISQGDYYQNATKLQSSIISNTQPDLTLLEVAQVGQFGYSGALADLNAYFDKTETANYIEGLMRNSYINGQLMGIPFNRSTPILYINRTMIQEKGLDPKGPETWEDLVTYARVLTDPQKEIFGFSTPIDIWFYEAGVFQQGGSIFSSDGKKVVFNSSEGTAIVRLWQDMVVEKIMKAPVGQDYNAWDVTQNDFATGKVAMVQLSTASLGGLLKATQGQFDLGTAFLPAGKQRGVPTGGACLVILKKAPEANKKAAAQFIKFLTNVENASLFSEFTGYMPVTHAAVASERVQNLHQMYPQYKVALEQLNFAQTRPMVKGYREMSVIMQEEFKKAMRDFLISPENAVESAATKVQKILDQEN